MRGAQPEESSRTKRTAATFADCAGGSSRAAHGDCGWASGRRGEVAIRGESCHATDPVVTDTGDKAAHRRGSPAACDGCAHIRTGQCLAAR
jgi:hypothetical protein